MKKIGEICYIKIKNFVFSKEAMEKMKWWTMLWERIFGQELASRIYKEVLKIIKKMTNNPTDIWASDLNKHFKKEALQMANNIKWCSTSVITRNMRINAQMKCHYAPIRMANVKKSDNTKCCPGCGEHETFIYCWWAYK